MSLPDSHGLFGHLPIELRLKIWTELFSFTKPLRVRQYTRGSRDLSILRASRHIYNEAIHVLFEQNAILVTRNDFCSKTDAALKNPVPYQHIRHLVVGSFGESLQCFYYPTQCPSCKYPGVQFLDVLRDIPRLKTVVVDYHAHTKLFGGLRDALASSTAPKLTCVSLGYYQLSDASLGDVDISFQNLPLAKTYPALMELYAQRPTKKQAQPVLAALSAEYYENVTAVWCLLLESKKPDDGTWSFRTHIQSWWVDEDELVGLEAGERSRKLSQFTSAMQECLEFQAPMLFKHYRQAESPGGIGAVLTAP